MPRCTTCPLALAGAVVLAGLAAAQETFTIPIDGSTRTAGAYGETGQLGGFMQQAMETFGTVIPQTDGPVGFLQGVDFQMTKDEWTAQLDTLQAEHCSEPVFVEPSAKMPSFFGPSASLRVSTGICAMVWDETDDVLSLACEEPKITTSKRPALYSGKGLRPLQYQSKACSVENQFGTAVREVLYVFDHNGTFDPVKVSTEVNAKLATLMNEEIAKLSADGLFASAGKRFDGGLMGNTFRYNLSGPATGTVIPATFGEGTVSAGGAGTLLPTSSQEAAYLTGVNASASRK